MLNQLSLRNSLHVLFKNRRTVFSVALFPLVLFAIAVLPKASEYESAGSLMVKVVDEDGVAPDLLAAQQGRNAASASMMAKQIISSEQMIISSEDVRSSALRKLGVLHVYPSLANEPEQMQLDLALERLGKDFLAKVSGDTSVLALSVFNPSPEVAQQTLRAIISAAIEKQASVMRDPRTQFLDSRLKTLRVEVDAAQQALLKFKQDQHITSFEEERSLLLKQRDDIESDLSGLRTQLVAAEGRGRALQTSLHSTSQMVAVTDENDSMRLQLDEAQERVAASRSRLAQIAARTPPGSAEYAEQEAMVQAAESRFRDIREQSRSRARKSINPLTERVSADLTVARSEVTANDKAAAERTQQLAAINLRLGTLDSAEITLNELERKRTIAEQEYQSYLARAQSARIVSDMNAAGITNLSVVQQPTLPHRPTRPRKVMLFFMALLAGIVCAVGACVLLELLDDRPSLPEQVEQVLEVPILASITMKRAERLDA